MRAESESLWCSRALSRKRELPRCTRSKGSITNRALSRLEMSGSSPSASIRAVKKEDHCEGVDERKREEADIRPDRTVLGVVQGRHLGTSEET
jgi:hypothetical protein